MAGRQRGNGAGSVTKYKTPKGKIKYRVRISLGTYFDDKSMKFKVDSKSLGVFNTKAEAEVALAEYNNSPFDLETKVKTVGDLYKVFADWLSVFILPSSSQRDKPRDLLMGKIHYIFYNKVNSFLLNCNSPSSRILHSSFDIALRSTQRKSASCCLVKGIVNWLLLCRFASSER